MAKKKKSKTIKKVTKKTPKKKVTKKASPKKKSAAKKISPKKIMKKAVKNKSIKKIAQEVVEDASAEPVKKKRKKRVTKAETLRLMQEEQLVKKWQSLVKQMDQIETAKYNMNEIYDTETAINHKKMGWGFIISNTNDRLEVLFETGIKNLISNYKIRK